MEEVMLEKEMWKESIFSDGSALFIDNTSNNIGDKVNIKIRLLKTSPVETVYIRYSVNGEETAKEMSKVNTVGELDYYNIEVLIEEKIFKYHFIICTANEMYFYNQRGLFDYTINEEYDFKLIADSKSPDWVNKSIFYQIFVDRFFNGDASNDVENGEYEYNGFKTSKIPWGQEAGEYKDYGGLDFYGGDLQGIEKKIGYLKELGVNAVYLNPIFTAPSNHKYDCSDYLNVDSHFGGNEALESLVKRLHEEGIKILLDISINHTGELHSWFENNKDLYFFKENEDYECWCGVKSLPVLNYNNKELNELIYKREDSVLKKWMKAPYSIDGWRFDVGHNVGKMKESRLYKDVWKNVRNELKGIDKEKYLLAEHWTDCSEYLQGDMWDSTMNYFGFERPARKYLGERDWYFGWKTGTRPMKKRNANVFINEVMQHYAKLPYELQNIQFNLLGSHDLHRIQNSEEICRENLKCGIMMLFTFLGAPCIYYGDEVALDGKFGSNEGCRYPMEWDEEKWDKEINNLYKKMISLRNTEEVLQTGSFKFMEIDSEILSYARFNEKEAIIFLNSQSETERELTLSYDILGEVKSVEPILGAVDIKKDKEFNINIMPKETILFKIKF